MRFQINWFCCQPTISHSKYSIYRNNARSDGSRILHTNRPIRPSAGVSTQSQSSIQLFAWFNCQVGWLYLDIFVLSGRLCLKCCKFRSQYTYPHPPHNHHPHSHHHHHRSTSSKQEKNSCSGSGWRGTFIGLVLTAMVLLFTVVSLGVWKYVQVPTNQSVNSPTNNEQQLLPTNEPIQCSTNVETGKQL